MLHKTFFDPLLTSTKPFRTVSCAPEKLNNLNVDGLQVDQKSDSVTLSGSKYVEMIFFEILFSGKLFPRPDEVLAAL